MRRLDFYVEHMLKQNAQGIVMRSEEPVEFRFGPGNVRRSNQPINHKQVLQLVREVAPPESVEQLRRTGQTRFTTKGQPGASIIYLAVEARAAESWRVIISVHEIDSSYDEPGAPGGEEWGGLPPAGREFLPEVPRAPEVGAAGQLRRAPATPPARLFGWRTL